MNKNSSLIFLAILVILPKVVTAQDSLNVSKVGEILLDGAVDVQIAGNYACIADAWDRVRILDLADIADPIEIGNCATGGAVNAIAVTGSHIYVADGYLGLGIINYLDPYHPFQEGSYFTGEDVLGVAVSGDYVYLSEGG